MKREVKIMKLTNHNLSFIIYFNEIFLINGFLLTQVQNNFWTPFETAIKSDNLCESTPTEPASASISTIFRI